jgi:hypothetical protein
MSAGGRIELCCLLADEPPQPIGDRAVRNVAAAGGDQLCLAALEVLAGDREQAAAAQVLLHGFPTSSHMFRDLIPLLADRYHLVAPNLPGFGFSDVPDRARFPAFFLPAGAEAFRRDNPMAEIRLYDTGHFALETHAEEIGAAIHHFLRRNVEPSATAK